VKYDGAEQYEVKENRDALEKYRKSKSSVSFYYF
jgi:hypothetical protein